MASSPVKYITIRFCLLLRTSSFFLVLHVLISCNSFQRYFPRTLEALILHMLSPIAAEVLTQKFDEIDQQTGEEDRFVLKHCCVFISIL